MGISLAVLFLTYLYFWLAGFSLLNWFDLFKGKSDHQLLLTFVGLPLTGFLVHIPLLSSLSLAVPIHLGVLVILCLLFIVIAFSCHRKLPAFFVPGRHLFILIFLLVFILGAALAQIPALSDTWGYHAQAVRWTESYPVIKGLGNLCGKYAFNFGTFLPSALLSFRFLTGQAVFGINAFLWLLAGIAMILNISREENFIAVIFLLLFFLSGLHYFLPLMSSTSVESASLALVFLMFFVVWEYQYHASGPVAILFLFILTALAVLLPVIKLSNLIFSLMVIPVLIRMPGKMKVASLILIVVCVLPWLIRNVLMTGYFAYPFPWPDFLHVDWKVPNEMAWQEFDWVRSWARQPFTDSRKTLESPLLVWLPDWFSRLGILTRVLFIALIASVILFLSSKRARMHLDGFLRWFWVISILQLCFCLILAPDPRFAMPSLIMAGLIPLTTMHGPERLIQWLNPFLHYKIMIPGLLLTLGLIIEGALMVKREPVPLLKPHPFPSVEMKRITINNITLFTPSVGVNCYDHPLISVHQLHPGLKLRDAHIVEGFYLDPLMEKNNTDTPLP